MGGARPPASSRSQVLRGVIAGLVVALPLIGWLTWPWGVREVSVGRLRITPPAPGTCVGLVEATVVNGTLEPVRVEAPNVWEDGTGDGAMDSGYAGGPLDTVFVNFGRTEPGFTLAPGGARVL